MYSHRALRILKRLPGGRSRFADEAGAQKKTEGFSFVRWDLEAEQKTDGLNDAMITLWWYMLVYPSYWNMAIEIVERSTIKNGENSL